MSSRFLLFCALAPLLFSGLSLSPCAGEGEAPASVRQKELFDRDWRFFLGDPPDAATPAFDDSSWRTLDLPHDWSIEGPPNIDPGKRGHQEGPFDPNSPAGGGGAYLNGGIGWYRKTFSLPDSARGRRVSILFDGAYENAEVWINGRKLGVHPYGFTSFFFDLTSNLKFGAEKNVLAVRLQVDQPGLRWYSGAGIYRHVYLITTRPVHVAQWGTSITTPKAEANGTEVRVATQVQNDGVVAAHAILTTLLLDPSGREVGRKETAQDLSPGMDAAVEQTIPLSSASLWSPDHPVLYHAVSEVRVAGKLTDSCTTPFGIRTIAFTKDQGFLLNGRRVQIKGVCDHHDLGCLGAAAYRRALQRQIEVLKSFGCNALRTSHNPPSPELLELCDQMGMLVMDEAFDEWKENHQRYGYADIFEQWSEPDLVSMLDRDRNHPSIVIWSIGNEIKEGYENTPGVGETARRLVAICHREDPTRPVTSACPDPGQDWKSGLAPALDVFGINYGIGWYNTNNPSRPDTSKPGDTGYHGQLPMLASETSSQIDSRGEYGLRLDDQGHVQIDYKTNNQVSSYDTWCTSWANSAESDLLALKNSPWVAGEFVWTGFDYLGEPTPYGWPSRSSYFGIVDLAGFPKDRYYLYKSQWSTEPVVHILPMKWTWPGFEGKSIPVHVCTNAASVELFLNGKSLGARNYPADCAPQTLAHENKDQPVTYSHPPGLQLAWEVPYAPGELKAVASTNGRVVATDIVRTAGVPVAIALAPDRDRIDNSGQDLSFIKVAILDKDGNVCPDAGNELEFKLTGDAAVIAGLDNGDATNHEPFQGTRHLAYHGLALVVLKSVPDQTGRVVLTASSDGLNSISTEIKIVPAANAQ